MLFPDEVKLFKKINIKPCLAIGKSLTHGSFKILTYQLTENMCPHFQENSCTIYQERPLACKAYPFVTSDNLEKADLAFSLDCTFIKESMVKYGGTHKFAHCKSIEAKLDLTEKLQDYNILRNRKSRKWIYNLKTEKWKRYIA